MSFFSFPFLFFKIVFLSPALSLMSRAVLHLFSLPFLISLLLLLAAVVQPTAQQANGDAANKKTKKHGGVKFVGVSDSDAEDFSSDSEREGAWGTTPKTVRFNY